MADTRYTTSHIATHQPMARAPLNPLAPARCLHVPQDVHRQGPAPRRTGRTVHHLLRTRGASAMTLAVAAPRCGTGFAANAWSSCTSVQSAGNGTPCAQDRPRGKPKTKTSRWPQSGCWPPRTSVAPTTTLAAGTAQMSSGCRRWRFADPPLLPAGALAGTSRRQLHQPRPGPRGLRHGAAGQPIPPRRAAEHLGPDLRSASWSGW